MNQQDVSGEERRRSRRGAVIFLLDRAYLPGLKVLCFTLREAIAADTHDIVVMSDDPAVAEDPFVVKLAKRIILVPEADIERVSRVRSDAVHDIERHPRLGKYTFLKFMCFGDLGYDHHLFLDVDMMCLRRSFRFEELVSEHDFAATLSFGRKRMKLHEFAELPTPERRDAIRDRFIQLAERDTGLSSGLNSGVWYARHRILGDETIRLLIETGERQSYTYEQEITHEVFRSMPGLRFRRLPGWYNVNEGSLRAMAEVRAKALRPRIALVHYNKQPKPWMWQGADWLRNDWWAAHAESQAWIAERS